MDSQFSKALLENYQNGDSNAAFEIHSRYAQRLFALARSRIGNHLVAKLDPDDVVQTAFQAFFEKADRSEIFWSKQGDLWRFLSAICINHVKREAEFYGAAKRDASLERPADPNIEQKLNQASVHLSELLESILHEEPPLTARIVRARLAGFKLAEIAARTGRSERTIRRVLQGLKARLAMMSALNLDSHLLQDTRHDQKNDAAKFQAKYDDFDLLRMLGAGAFGKVYLARNRITDSLVAVKALRRSWLGDTKAESLFLNEAKILDSIEHPNVVKFLDAGPLPNGSWFIVMEYADGRALDQVVQSGANSNEITVWLGQICMALEEIHRRGMTHGDLKPSNVIVAQGHVRLIDFGFSRRATEPGKTWLGGTTGFVAPERESSSAADVFAFGRIVEFVLRESTEFSEKEISLLSAIATEACADTPDQRPTASQLIARIAKALKTGQ